MSGSVKEILPRYTAITGAPAVPPKWSFGLWMGRISYNRQEQVETVAQQLCEHRIPLEELVSPAVANQTAYYRQLGLLSRILTLPLVVASVLTMGWRHVPSVHELTRMLAREDLLWCQAVKVSQQALNQRFLVFPAAWFERVYGECQCTQLS